jgi:hypothetical protein
MTARWATVTRGLLAATFATFVAALFHVAGGGADPSALAIVVSLTFSGLACIALAGRRLSRVRLSISVALSQLIFHALFSLGQPGVILVSTHGIRHVHDATQMAMMGGGLSVAGVQGAQGMQGMQGLQDVIPDTPLMWVSHIAAAVVTIVAISRGEKAIRAVCALARIVAARLVPVQDATPLPHLRSVTTQPFARRLALPNRARFLGRMRHRGPPAQIAAA